MRYNSYLKASLVITLIAVVAIVLLTVMIVFETPLFTARGIEMELYILADAIIVCILTVLSITFMIVGMVKIRRRGK